MDWGYFRLWFSSCFLYKKIYSVVVMKNKPYVRFNVHIKGETLDKENGVQLFELFNVLDERLEPEFIGLEEKNNFPINDIDVFLKYWTMMADVEFDGRKWRFPRGFMFKRNRAVKYFGRFSHSYLSNKNQAVMGGLTLDFKSLRFDIPYREFLIKVCEIFDVHYGVVHCFNGFELGKYGFGSPEDMFQSGFVGSEKNKVVDLGWSTYLGSELMKSSGADFSKIRESGFDAEKINDGVLITLSESIENIYDDFYKFSSNRRLLKQFFSEGFFQLHRDYL